MRLKIIYDVQGAEAVPAGMGNLIGANGIFQVTEMIPPYFLQIIIGVYLIQMVFILTRTLVTINSGEDKLDKTNKTGKNLASAMTLYFITAAGATIALFVLTSIVVGGLG